MVGDVFFGADIRIHRRQVIDSVQLQAVTGIKEECRAARHQVAAKFGQGAPDLAQAEIVLFNHGKAESTQFAGHGSGVVDRVFQGRAGIAGIADDQGDALAVGLAFDDVARRQAGLDQSKKRRSTQRSLVVNVSVPSATATLAAGFGLSPRVFVSAWRTSPWLPGMM